MSNWRVNKCCTLNLEEYKCKVMLVGAGAFSSLSCGLCQSGTFWTGLGKHLFESKLAKNYCHCAKTQSNFMIPKIATIFEYEIFKNKFVVQKLRINEMSKS